MSSAPVLVAMLLLVASSLASGSLLVRTRASFAGGLLVVTGLGLAAALVLDAAGRTSGARYLLVGALVLVAPFAALGYPRLGYRHPVDFVSITTLGAAGLLATARATDLDVVGPMGLLIGLTLIGHVWWRLERGDEDERQARLWLALAAGTSGLLYGFSIFLADPAVGATIGICMVAAIGPAMVLGVRGPHLVDVRGLLVQTVVFAVAAVAYVAVFVGLVSVFRLLGGATPAVGLLAVVGALAATTLHPLRVVLRGVVDELLFGDRPDPLDAATRVADRIGDDPVLALRAIREALVLPYASLWVGGRNLATSGTEVTHTRRLPLALGEDTVGEIVVGLRAGDLGLSTGDENVLRIVAPLLAQTLRARALAADLQESRGLAISAIEEERRRLRRDLHDGLGPTLSGIAFTADAARNTLRSRPEEADALLRGLRADTVAAIEEIRRLVYGMRPPALDELGLVPALRQQAAGVRTAGGSPMLVDMVAPDDLPALPAAVEVAAYRIVLEALTNIARHSTSESASIRIGMQEGALTVEVCDAGATSAPWVAGVGMASMRERAAEVGGWLTAGGTADGGLVRASLPLAVG